MSAKTALAGMVQKPGTVALHQLRERLLHGIRSQLQGAARVERMCLFAILGVTAFLYTWNLDVNGWANPYYSAAAQAGAADWKAWFFGSADAGNLVSIDKTPLSVWAMGLSARIFGLSSWSILLPQVVMGVATTWLMYKIIRTSQGAAAALLGAVVYASIPIVVLMSRFNNPDPLMGLLVVAAAYFAVRAAIDARLRWYLLAGAALGLAFMAKQLQALLIIPAITVVVLFAGSGPLRRRISGLACALAGLVTCGGWWVLLVDAWPAHARPYMGGSGANSAVELTANYNGLQRFSHFTNQSGTAAVADPQSSFDVARAGFTRLFSADFAPEIAWFIFPALACAAVLLVLKQSTNPAVITPAALLGAVWLLTVLGVLIFAGTMVHTYYTYSLAAPIALVIPMGLSKLAAMRERPMPKLLGIVIILASSYLASRILDYSDGWPPGMPLVVCAVGAIASLVWWMPAVRRSAFLVIPVAASLLTGPTVTNFYTVNTAQGGTNPLSGPPSSVEGSLSKKFEAARAGREPRTLNLAFGAPPDPTLVQLLTGDTEHRWAAVTVTAQNAALYQLESRRPVAALGGWLGLDPAPTLEDFKVLVADGTIGIFIDQPELLRAQSVGVETSQIISWVRKQFTASDIGGQRVYFLDQKL